MSAIGELPFSANEYGRRQERFFSNFDTDTLILIPTNSIKIRSNDTSFPFRANSYMLYLCGCNQPEAVFMAYHNSTNWQSCLFVQPRDTRTEKFGKEEELVLRGRNHCGQLMRLIL